MGMAKIQNKIDMKDFFNRIQEQADTGMEIMSGWPETCVGDKSVFLQVTLRM